MATEPIPVEERKSEIVDLTEGISDLEAESEAEIVDGDDETKSKGAPRANKKRRKGRRGGKKTKKGKELEKARKLEEALHAVNASDGDAPSSRTLSEAEVLATGTLFQSHYSSNPPVDVPVLPHHAIRRIPSSTSHTTKTALFATRFLSAGTRIIRERALINLPYPGDDPLQLISAYHALPAAEQKAIMSLNASAPTASPFLTHIGTVIMSSAAHLLSIRNKPHHTRTPEEQAKLEIDGARLASTALLARLVARWHAGRCSLIDLADIDGASLHAHVPITGLFIDTARLGQSCMPNCYARYNALTGEMTVHTVRDVAVGEELNLSAMRSVHYRTTSERKNELAEKFGIECTCAACIPAPDDTSGVFADQEKLRKSAFEHVVQISRVLDKLTHHANDEAYFDQAPALDDLNSATKTIHTLITNLAQSGGEGNPEQLRWYNALINRIQPHAIAQLHDGEKLGYWSYMRTQAGKAEELARMAFGADSSEYVDARKRREGLDAVCAEEEERKEMVRRGREKLGLEFGASRVETEEEELQEGEVVEDVKQGMKEWEIVGLVEKRDEETIKDEKGEVVGNLGMYTLTEE
ncbi:hypothetical protein BKA63DRAFT_183467 [Paraphoma chrysanthemicola]|nr:hypothetical protein BKA63DRAFT_183467 [Paraphoma chrysanthemicola]